VELIQKKTPTKKSARGKGEDDLYFFCLKKANKGKSKYLPATEITVKKDKNQNVISVIDKKKKKETKHAINIIQSVKKEKDGDLHVLAVHLTTSKVIAFAFKNEEDADHLKEQIEPKKKG